MPFVPDPPAASTGHFVPDAPAAPPPAAPEAPGLLRRVASGAADLAVNENPIAGAAEKAAQGASALGSKVVGGYAGLGQIIAHALGLVHGDYDPAATVHAVEDAGTYQPRTNAAHVIDQAGAEVAKPFEAAAAPLERKIAAAGPGVSTFAPAGAEALTDILGLVGPGKAGAEATAEAGAPKVVEGAAKPAVGAGNTAIETGRAAGFKFTPGGVESRNPAGDVPQSFATSPTDRRAINLHNQAQATSLARQDIGLPPGTTLSPQDIETAMKPHAAVYNQTGQTLGQFKPTPKLADDLAGLEDDQSLDPKVRKNVKQLQLQAASGQMDGPTLIKNIGYLRQNGARDVADALEAEVERQLTASENIPQLTAYRGARQGFAKIYNVRDATTGGQVSAPDLVRLDEKYPGLLTGNLKLIAQTAAASPQDFRLPSGVKPGSSPVSKPTLIGAAKAITGKVAKLVAPGRFDVTSDAFQNRFGREGTPTELSYLPSMGARPAPPSPGFRLAPPPGTPGVVPRQGTLTLPPGAAPRPPYALEAPPGTPIEPAQRTLTLPPGPEPRPPYALEAPPGTPGVEPHQLGFQIAQGRPLGDQVLTLQPSDGGFEPHQPSLLGHEGTPEGGARKVKAKRRGKD